MDATAIRYEMRRQAAALVFDPEDRFARGWGAKDLHPRPIGQTRYFVVERLGPGDPGPISPELEMVVRRNASGYDLFYNSYKLPDDTPRQNLLPNGRYRIRVENLYYQPERLNIDLPMPKGDTPYFVDLRPSYAYPFPNPSPIRLESPLLDNPQLDPCSNRARQPGNGPTLLRGDFRRTNGEGIENAQVEFISPPGQPNVDAYTTDKTGQWVLALPNTQPTGRVRIRLRRPGASAVELQDVCVVRGRDNLLAQAALRGWVQTSTGAGITGATIEVSGFSAEVTTGADGSWSYFFRHDAFDPSQPVPPVSVTATLPDERNQTQDGVIIQPRASVLVPTFRF